jgi:hypothetical protein
MKNGRERERWIDMDKLKRRKCSRKERKTNKIN